MSQLKKLVCIYLFKNFSVLIFFRISETMMATEALNEQQVKEKDRIEKLYAKLVNAFEKFLEVMIKDANSLEKAKNGLNFGLKRGK